MTSTSTGRCTSSDGRIWIAAAACALAALIGCGRAHYRLAADDQTYQILAEKESDPRWAVPKSSIMPDPRSRFYDACNPDDPPLPPDDPAANQYMQRVYGMRGSKKWRRLARLDTVENPLWPTYLGGQPLSTSGRKLPRIDHLSLDQAIELGLIHSREYQEQLENVYLAALALTGHRYRFDVRPVGFLGEPGTSLFYKHQPEDRSDLELGTTHFGFRKLFPTGAQLIAEMANSTIWLFSGPDTSGTASSFAYTLVQPLLEGAGRAIVLEALTQAERGVLYAVRDFARFRRDFYVMVITGERAIPLPSSSARGELAFLIRGERSPTVGFNFLLARLQLFRNYQEKVQNLAGRLRDLKSLAKQGRATSLNITQVQSSLQEARYMENRAERQFNDELDRFKMQLGLPPDMEISVDDSRLDPFQFRNPSILDLSHRIRQFVESVALAPQGASREVLESRTAKLDSMSRELRASFEVTGASVRRLRAAAASRQSTMTTEQFQEFQDNIASIVQRRDQLRDDLDEARQRWPGIDKSRDISIFTKPQRAALEKTIAEQCSNLVRGARSLSGLDLDVRVELVALKPVDLTFEQVVSIALRHRLDLMNQRAMVVDARRRMEVAANRLKGTLNIVADGEVNTPPLLQNDKLFNFRADQSRFRVGLEVVTPLDRRRQRNDFRASQISYQRARRNYMAAEDQVKLDVRKQLRSVRARAQAFEIRRRGLRVAVRELEQSIQTGERIGSGAELENQQGVNITRAVDNIVQAQNSMLFIWEDYEKDRLSLFRDMGVMWIADDDTWDEARTTEIVSSELLEEVLPIPLGP